MVDLNTVTNGDYVVIKIRFQLTSPSNWKRVYVSIRRAGSQETEISTSNLLLRVDPVRVVVLDLLRYVLYQRSSFWYFQ